jgi:putative ABC transport system permease protein
VADLKYAKLDEEPAPETYVPYRYAPFLRGMNVVVLVDGNASRLGSAMRQIVADVDRTQPVYDVETVEQALAESIAPRRFNLLLLSVFAAAALALAVIGVYGVTSYAVAQRSQEIGVRMALGATRRSVYALALSDTGLPVFGGLLAGLATSAIAGRAIRNLLYGTQAVDPAVILAVAGLFLLSATVAALLPARRAASLDPMDALRSE